MGVDKAGDFSKYYTVQVWSHEDIGARNLGQMVRRIAKELKRQNNATIEGIDGPTFFLPDFFSELYGNQAGYLILVKRDAHIDSCELKRTCIGLERDSLGRRVCDIDVYVSYSENISRTKLGIPKETGRTGRQ